MGKFADDLKASLAEALAHAEGERPDLVTHVVTVPEEVDVEGIRKHLGTSGNWCRSAIRHQFPEVPTRLNRLSGAMSVLRP